MKMSVCGMTRPHRPQANSVFANGTSLSFLGVRIGNGKRTSEHTSGRPVSSRMCDFEAMQDVANGASGGAGSCHEQSETVCGFVHGRDAIAHGSSQLLRSKTGVASCASAANPHEKHDGSRFVWAGSRLHKNPTFGDGPSSRELGFDAEVFVGSRNESCHELTKTVSPESSRTKQNAAAFCDSSCADSSAKTVQSFACNVSGDGTISRSDGSREGKNAAAFFAFRSGHRFSVRVRRGDAISHSTALPETGLVRAKGLLASPFTLGQDGRKDAVSHSPVCPNANAANDKSATHPICSPASEELWESVGARRSWRSFPATPEHADTSAQNALGAVFACDISSPKFQFGASFSCGSCSAKRSRDAFSARVLAPRDGLWNRRATRSRECVQRPSGRSLPVPFSPEEWRPVFRYPYQGLRSV